MKEKLQKFGGAMFTPILFFSAFGILVAFCTVFRNPMIMGSLANEGTHWSNWWKIIQDGAWTIFNQLEVLFAVSLPLGLAKKAQGKAAIESLVIYLAFLTLVSGFLTYYGRFFGVDIAVENTTGIKMIAGIQTLDTGIIGAIVIASIVVWFHNNIFDKRLPEIFGTFQGSPFVTLVSFFAMIPLAFLTCLIWPKIQIGINSLQVFFNSSGALGIGVYTFLERFLLPTGLHHFIWTPFLFGPAAIEGGISPHYILNMQDFANSSVPLIEQFPEGGFGLIGNIKLFAPIGIAAAFYFTAKPERRKRVLAVILPVALTAIISGITEPLEFTFLFIAPSLFLAYCLIAGIMAIVMYSFGVVLMGSGLIDVLAKMWIPMFANHSGMIITQIIIGLVFAFIYFLVFRFMITKFNYATPGRELDNEINQLAQDATIIKTSNDQNDFKKRAEGYLKALGGKQNINSVNNCATRLRIQVVDTSIVSSDEEFKEWGALGIVRNGNSFQIIIGMDVGNIRAEFDEMIN